MAHRPSDWLETRFAAWFEDHDPVAGHARVSLDDLLTGGLGALHERLLDQGTPPKAAAKYLAGWFGGIAGRSLGFAAVSAGAWFEIDGSALRWHVHPDGWADRLELGAPVALIAPGHPWSGEPGTVTVADEAERHERVVRALAAAVRPLIDALRPLGPVGSPGLWAEVADGLGGPLAYQSALPVTAERLALLRGLVSAEGAPWKARPSLWTVDGVCVMRKGGCCRAYTVEGEYCGQCPLRDPASCEAEQLAWAREA